VVRVGDSRPLEIQLRECREALARAIGRLHELERHLFDPPARPAPPAPAQARIDWKAAAARYRRLLQAELSGSRKLFLLLKAEKEKALLLKEARGGEGPVSRPALPSP